MLIELSKNEEDYLKALFSLQYEKGVKKIGTNAIAAHLSVKPASANGMLKRLQEKKLVHLKKYGSIRLSDKGFKASVLLIRKHRLWESFLVDKLNFSWDKVHDIAEQLEHIKSVELIDKLDAYLGNPKVDPHGDEIPTPEGKMVFAEKKLLANLALNVKANVVGINDDYSELLKYASKIGIDLNAQILVKEKHDFDGSLTIVVKEQSVNVSQKFSNNIYVA